MFTTENINQWAFLYTTISSKGPWTKVDEQELHTANNREEKDSRTQRPMGNIEV